MRTTQYVIRHADQLAAGLSGLADQAPQLLLVFGSIEHLASHALASTLRAAAPGACLLGCSTAGEISADGVEDNACVVTAVNFDSVQLRPAATPLADMADSAAAGRRIGEQLAKDGLRAILVFGPGVAINGSALVAGIVESVGPTVPISGGLAGDGGAFQQTLTLGDGGVTADHVVAVGLYGDALSISHGSFGGWEPFGPARKVTRCEGNVLFELDGEPALSVYKRYLGDYAKDLPASGLLFPFAMLGEDHGAVGLIRTILGIDESSGSLTLAGEIEADGYLKLMHASTDRLVFGAETAAEGARLDEVAQVAGLAILVSCVGRKLVMGARVDEEVEAVGDVLGSEMALAGFYSYGEISPFGVEACGLHNQTMTITCLTER